MQNAQYSCASTPWADMEQACSSEAVSLHFPKRRQYLVTDGNSWSHQEQETPPTDGVSQLCPRNSQECAFPFNLSQSWRVNEENKSQLKQVELSNECLQN